MHVPTPTSPRLGIHFCPTDAGADVVELALEAQRLGFSSLAVPEHTHIPVDSEFPTGGEVPERYRSAFDPYTALAFVAARTTLRIGTGISLVAQHDPIALAKRTATLDRLSGGRFTLGVGFGWNRLEFEGHGRTFVKRREITRSHIGLMREVWSHEIVEFSGPHASLRPSWVGPKPATPGGPPVLLGAPASPKNVADIVDWADGWMPVTGAPAMIADGVAALREAWAAAGRAGSPRLHVLHLGATGDALPDVVHGYAELGVDEVLLDVPSLAAEAALDVLHSHGAHVAGDER